jgi:hypothetical protein
MKYVLKFELFVFLDQKIIISTQKIETLKNETIMLQNIGFLNKSEL